MARNYDARPLGLATALAMIILLLLSEAPVLVSMIFSGSLIAGAYWVYVKRLLPELPAIDLTNELVITAMKSA